MSFTVITVELPKASGTIRFQLSEPISNGPDTQQPTPVTATLDPNNAVTVALPANDDTGTTPEGSSYWVLESVTGVSQREYGIVVPHDAPGGTVTLASLMPGQPGFG